MELRSRDSVTVPVPFVVIAFGFSFAPFKAVLYVLVIGAVLQAVIAAARASAAISILFIGSSTEFSLG